MGRLIFIKTGNFEKDYNQLVTINKHYKNMYRVMFFAVALCMLLFIIYIYISV